MRGLFSLVGLLVVLAIVGLVAKRQLTATGGVHAASAASSPQVNSAEQTQQLQKQVQDDVNQLMQSRTSDVDQQVDAKP